MQNRIPTDLRNVLTETFQALVNEYGAEKAQILFSSLLNFIFE